MQRSGTESWLLSISSDGTPHEALYVRDALRLCTSGDLSPPRALDGVPDRSELLSTGERGRAAAQWLPWWRAVLELEAQFHEPGVRPSSTEEFLAFARESHAERVRRLGEPPDFEAMTDWPELRKAVVALHPEARTWAGRVRAPNQREGWWEQTRDVAEEVARACRVSPGAVRGTVQVLAVEGSWWRLLGSGSVVCSVAAFQDHDVAAEILRTTFTSGLET
ncbi:hypothetical protein GCM10023169_20260 [Georgenia halophila]|uniref:Uncharacterized protein n=1 Tax=Georgenia halophila TaxID=620889 RepID=A0ABP8L6V3_9MICO